MKTNKPRIILFFLVLLINMGLLFSSFTPTKYQQSDFQQRKDSTRDSIFRYYFEKHLTYLEVDSVRLADTTLQLAIERAKSIKDTSLLLLGLKTQAEFESEEFFLHRAIETDRNRIEISSKINDTEEEAEAINHLRKVFYDLNIVDSAIYYCSREIELNRSNKRFDLLSRSYWAMTSYIRSTLGGMSKNSFLVENLMDSMLQASFDSHDRGLIADMLIGYGVSLYQNDFDKGLAYINQGLDSAMREKPFKHIQATGLYQRGVAYYDFDLLAQAEADFLETLDLVRSNNIDHFEGKTLFQLASVYYKQGRYQDALKYCCIANELVQSEGLSYKLGIYRLLATLYEMTNHKDSSIFYLKKQLGGLYDEFGQYSMQQIAISGARFQISEHKDRINELDYQNNHKELISRFQLRFIFVLSVSLLVVIILIVILNNQYRLTKKAYKNIQDKNDLLAKQKEQITTLREQKREELTDRLEETHAILEILMRSEKLYLNPELSLSSLAILLKINSNYLSNLINKSCMCNFTQYIDKYRIEEAIVLFTEGKHKTYSIEAISKMVGYKSKSAFYRAFRQQQSVMPTEYIKTLFQ